MDIRKNIVFIFGLFFVGQVWAAIAKLTDMRLAQDANNKNIVLEVDGNIHYKWFTLSNPNRLIIDLSNTKLQAKLQGFNFAGMPIKSVRTGVQKGQILRLVFDLTQPIQPQVSTQLQGSGKRITIGFTGASSTHDTAPAKLALAPIKPVIEEPIIPTMISSQGRRKVVVVIDPGHGGKDPGAHGLRGTLEKDVVLAISKNLAALLNSMPGYSAVLTRKGDYFIELRDRLVLARKDKADMFIAIHADAFINHEARGSSVFALSARGASSEAARWLAERENYSELGGVNLEDLQYKDNMLRSVLIDLSQNATIGSSLQLGGAVLHSLGKINKLHHGKVEQAGFMVLKSPDVPSILVETGFISNPVEEANLRSPSYQQRIAQALYQGIMDYFQQNPPEGTLVATNIKPQRYIVARGDTVTSIARRYKISAATLKNINNLRTNVLTLGQVLLIPQGSFS